MVAHGHGFDAIGFDLDERNADLARERVGPMFFQEATTGTYSEHGDNMTESNETVDPGSQP